MIFCFEISTTRNSLILVSKFQVYVIEEEVEPFSRTKDSFSVNQIQCQPTKREEERNWSTATLKRARLNSILKMENLGVSQTGSLSDLKSFGRHVIESSSSKAPENVGRCIMNLIRMKSEFYHDISPWYANLS